MEKDRKTMEKRGKRQGNERNKRKAMSMERKTKKNVIKGVRDEGDER